MQAMIAVGRNGNIMRNFLQMLPSVRPLERHLKKLHGSVTVIESSTEATVVLPEVSFLYVIRVGEDVDGEPFPLDDPNIGIVWEGLQASKIKQWHPADAVASGTFGYAKIVPDK